MNISNFKWPSLIPAFILSGFLFPLVYVFGLNDIFGGIFIKLCTALSVSIILGFFVYPFVKAYQCQKSGAPKAAIALGMFGIFLPVLSGVIGIVAIEYLGIIKLSSST